LRKWVSSATAAGKLDTENPAATSLPMASSAENLALSHSAFGVAACVSWLPLGDTGLAPLTVNTAVALPGGDAVVDELPVAGEAGEAGSAPVADEAAEHDTDSAAIAHRHATEVIRLFIWGQPRLSPPMLSDPSLADQVPSSAWLT